MCRGTHGTRPASRWNARERRRTLRMSRLRSLLSGAPTGSTGSQDEENRNPNWNRAFHGLVKRILAEFRTSVDCRRIATKKNLRHEPTPTKRWGFTSGLRAALRPGIGIPLYTGEVTQCNPLIQRNGSCASDPSRPKSKKAHSANTACACDYNRSPSRC